MVVLTYDELPKSAKQVAAFATSIMTSMTGNANFPNTTPALATVEADIAAFSAAESAALARTKGAVELRSAKLATLKADLGHLMAYVQSVANANSANAEAIILSAGMSVRKVTLHPKGEITVKPGTVSGTAKLVAKAVGARASYEWQFSTDQKTWTNAPPTLQSKTVVLGLSPATAYFFRFRGVTKAGEGNWSQVVSLLVI